MDVDLVELQKGRKRGGDGGDKGKEKHCNGIPGKEESAEQEHENLKRVANKKKTPAQNGLQVLRGIVMS